jgi:hypothetical protein
MRHNYGQFIQQIGNPSRLDPLALAEAMQQTVNLSLVVSWLQNGVMTSSAIAQPEEIATI